MKKINNVLILSVSIFSILYLILNFNSLDFSRVLILLSMTPVLLGAKILRKCNLIIPDWIEFIYVLFIIVGELFGCAFYMMQEIKYYDKVLHFASGILTSVFGLVLLNNTNLKNRTKPFDILFIIIFSIAIAGLWEIFEYTSDYILKGDTQNVLATGVNDTMQDIISATVSTILFSVIYSLRRKG